MPRKKSKKRTAASSQLDLSPKIASSADLARELKEVFAGVRDIAQADEMLIVPHPRFRPSEAQRIAIMTLADLPRSIRCKLECEDELFTIGEIIEMGIALAATAAEGHDEIAVMLLCENLVFQLAPESWQVTDSEVQDPNAGVHRGTDEVYQFKITLVGSEPSIWRRIEVEDCTLDDLHVHIQNSMGWANCHLHQFVIDGDIFGSPEILGDESDYIDSTQTMLSDILPDGKKKLRFQYEYDFGDGWTHEILFEKRLTRCRQTEYPRCTGGEMNCPPDDVGGIHGYYAFLEAMSDPTHERHADFCDWIGGDFNPKAFDAKSTTEAMKEI